MRHFVASWLTLFGGATEPLECFQKERLDVVRLQSPGLGSLHLFANAIDAARVHCIVRERTFFKEILELAPVESIGHDLCETCPDLRLVPVTGSLDQQLATRV